jgi:hypothetical protein
MVAETAYGVTPATPTFKPIRHTQTTLALSKEAIQSEELRSDRQITDYRQGARQVGGDISFELSYGSFDDILEALTLGTWAGNVLKAGVTRRSFTIERLFADLAPADNPYHRFTGVEFNTLALAINANAMITGTIGVLGQDAGVASAIIAGSSVAAPSTTSPLDSFTGSLKESGQAIAVITEIALNLDNGLAARFVVGSKTSIRPSIGRSNVSGTVTAYFENSNLLNKFINEIESSIEFTLPDGAGNSYTILMPRIKYTGGQPDVTGEGPITLAMPFQALLHSPSGTQLQITRTPAP